MKNFWKGKNVLITGASGFIGSNACAFFATLGSTVTATVSPKTNKLRTAINLHDVEDRVNIVQADLLSIDDVRSITKSQDVILHFAGIDGSLRFKQMHSADIFSHNMRINLNILEASAAQSIPDILIVSSADIYASTNETLLTERSPIAIDIQKEMDGYKLAKWSTELAVQEYHRQFGMNYVIVRPSNIYGPRDEFESEERIRFIPAAIKHVLTGKPIVLWGSGEQLRSFLYVDDFLSFCGQLIEKKIYNIPINIASEHKVSLMNTAQAIKSLLEKDVAIMTDNTKPTGDRNRDFDLSLLQEKVGKYTETDFQAGLVKTIEFYRRNYFP